MRVRAFVAQWLKANLPNAYRLCERYTARLQANELVAFRVDIVIEDRASGQPLMVLDTSYPQDAETPVMDARKAAAAAAKAGVAAAVVVYPSARPKKGWPQTGAYGVRAAGFDLDRPLADAGDAFLKQILRAD